MIDLNILQNKIKNDELFSPEEIELVQQNKNKVPKDIYVYALRSLALSVAPPVNSTPDGARTVASAPAEESQQMPPENDLGMVRDNMERVMVKILTLSKTWTNEDIRYLLKLHTILPIELDHLRQFWKYWTTNIVVSRKPKKTRAKMEKIANEIASKFDMITDEKPLIFGFNTYGQARSMRQILYTTGILPEDVMLKIRQGEKETGVLICQKRSSSQSINLTNYQED